MNSLSAGAASPSTALVANRTFDEIAVGDSASLSRILSQRDVDPFAVLSDNVEPLRLDSACLAVGQPYGIAGHGMWGGALVSAVLETVLPGPGAICLALDLKFRMAAGPGDTLKATVTARDKRSDAGIIVFDCLCTDQHGETVATGIAEVKAPTERMLRRRTEVLDVRPNAHLRYHRLIARCAALAPVVTAVVHPCDSASLSGAVEAASAGLILPVLVGRE